AEALAMGCAHRSNSIAAQSSWVTSLRDVQGRRSLRSRCPRDAWADPFAALQDPVGPAAAAPGAARDARSPA
ncbi:hypothetical protein, partial [Streptomyces scabiei]|uniref:hypothetical protein n=2 Tax=Streptomyces TaxID=1883 RepID=UPI0029A1333A